MGWEKGKGIGKEMQGRAVPVQAVLRKGKGAVGSYGAESKEAKSKWKRTGDGDESDEGGEAIGDGDEDETSDKDERIVNESQWKKTVCYLPKYTILCLLSLSCFALTFSFHFVNVRKAKAANKCSTSIARPSSWSSSPLASRAN